MRAADLLGLPAVTAGGRAVGHVRDLRLTGGGTSWRLTHLVLGPSALAYRLGYVGGEVGGPWPLAVLARRLSARLHYVRWDDVVSLEAHRVVLREGAVVGPDAAERAP